MPAWTSSGLTGRKRPARDALLDDRAERFDDARRCRASVAASRCGAAFGDLAEPDRRKVRPRLGLGGDGLDERADLVGRAAASEAATARDAGADGAEHVAQDLAVERRLAAEVVVDHRLVEAGGAGDAVDAGAGEPARGELGGGGGEEPVARAGGPVGLAAAAGARRGGIFTTADVVTHKLTS